MLHDGNETVGTNGRINLYSDSVLGSTPEFLDFEMLLEPLEEKFYLPTVLIEVCDLMGCQFRGIGQEHKLTTLLLIKESYKSKMRWISFLAAIDGQLYLRISQYSLGQSASPLDALVLQIGLGSYNKERLRTMYAVEFLEDVRCPLAPGFPHKLVGILLDDAVVAVGISLAQITSGHMLAKSEVITLLMVCLCGDNQVSHALAITKLPKHQRQ